ncbi:MAG: O-antigen ligase family protein, partial [Pirellulales bacterium]
ETRGEWQFVFPKYIVSPAFGEFYGRGRGPLLNPAATGLVETLGMCAALACWPRANWGGKLLLLVLLAIFIVGIYSTLTPSVWCGAGAALLVMVVLGTPRAWRARVSAATVLGATIALALGWQHLPALQRDLVPSAAPSAESARPRTVPADVAWHMFLDRPILGCGLGQYEREMPVYLSGPWAQRPLEKTATHVRHNVFLGLLTETGLLGAGLFCALLVSWIVTAWRLWLSATVPSWVRQLGLVFLAWMAAYLTGAMFHDLAIVPMVNMFLFFMGGAVMGLAAFLAIPRKRGSVKVWVPEEESQLVAY